MSKLTVEQVMELAPVIPVLVVDRVEDALTIWWRADCPRWK
jgi:2-dehydro-3-deoxyphosphogluconate aldolase / (4S)-4-hydroxy-2-oxoglutarate aldolase